MLSAEASAYVACMPEPGMLLCSDGASAVLAILDTAAEWSAGCKKAAVRAVLSGLQKHEAYPNYIRLAVQSVGSVVQAWAVWMMCCKYLQEGAPGATGADLMRQQRLGHKDPQPCLTSFISMLRQKNARCAS